jgi:hypothetical protein
MGGQPSSGGRYRNWRAGNGTEIRQLLCRRSACGNVPGGSSCGAANILKFGRKSCWKQDGYASACQRRLNGLMTQMADGTIVGRRSGMMMPNHPERGRYQEREERDGKDKSPNCASSSTFEGHFKTLHEGPVSLVQNLTFRSFDSHSDISKSIYAEDDPA